MALKLIYIDLAPGAAENATTTATKAESFSDVSALPLGVSTGAISTLEHNGWGLSHDYKAKGSQPIGLWTESFTDVLGQFPLPPVIEISFTAQYTATGLTLRFAPDAGEWCSEIAVEWYQNGAIKESGTYYPTSPLFAVENAVEGFDKVVISLVKTHLPFKRAKLEYIGIGIVREFDERELIDVSFLNEIDLVSLTVPINVMDATFHSNTDTEYIFQNKQLVEAYEGESLIGMYYIEKGTRTGARDYSINCQDIISALDHDTYTGDFWWEHTPVPDIITTVLGTNYELDIAAEVSALTLRGHIPKCTKREALQQIAFAAGLCVDTVGSNAIKIFVPSEELTIIPPEETYTGGMVETSDIVTAVTVLGYSIKNEEPYEGEDYVEFEGTQYRCAIVEYTATNPNISTDTPPNVITYDCTMCSLEDGQARADALMAYHMRRKKYTTSHILHDWHYPSQRARVALPWGGEVDTNIIKMQITMSGINASNSVFLLK